MLPRILLQLKQQSTNYCAWKPVVVHYCTTFSPRSKLHHPTTARTALRTSRIWPTGLVKDVITTAYVHVDRFISERTPRLVKHMLKALTKLSHQVRFTPQELILAGILLYRLQRQPNMKPPPELEAVQKQWTGPPAHPVCIGNTLHIPPYATPETSLEEMLTVKRVVQHCLAAYVSDNNTLLSSLGLQPRHLLASNWRADPETLVPAYFVAVDPGLKAVVIAVRGTYSLSDTLVNFTVAPEEVAGGTVHSGMYLTAQQLLNHLTTKIDLKARLDKLPGYSLLLTGHSMGGAVAALMAMMLKVEYPHARARVVAPPSCMSRTLAASCSSYITSYINGDDVVPRFHFDAIVRLKQALENVNLQREVLQQLHLDKVFTPEVVRVLLQPLETAWGIGLKIYHQLYMFADVFSIPLRGWGTAASAFVSHIRGTMEDLLIGQAHYLRPLRQRLGADTAEVVNAAQSKQVEGQGGVTPFRISDALEYAAEENALNEMQARTAGAYISSPHLVVEHDIAHDSSGTISVDSDTTTHTSYTQAGSINSTEDMLFNSDFEVEPGSIVHNPADPYGADEDEVADIHATFTVHTPSVLSIPSILATNDMPDYTDGDEPITQASGFAERVGMSAPKAQQQPKEQQEQPASNKVDGTIWFEASSATKWQFYPPGEVWYLCYPAGYVRATHWLQQTPRKGLVGKEADNVHGLYKVEEEKAAEAGVSFVEEEDDDNSSAHAFRQRMIRKNNPAHRIAFDDFGANHINIMQREADVLLQDARLRAELRSWRSVPHYCGPILVRLDQDAQLTAIEQQQPAEVPDILDPYDMETPWPAWTDSSSIDASSKGNCSDGTLHAQAHAADTAAQEQRANAAAAVAATIEAADSVSSIPVELTKLFDPARFFGHVVLSRDMFNDHLCASFIAELDEWINHVERTGMDTTPRS